VWRRSRQPDGPRKEASLLRNVGTNYLVTIVLVVAGFVTTPLLTHHLGIVRYGVWALLGSLIPYLELLELGFANATVSFVTRHLELDDDEKVHGTLNTSFLILSVLGILAFVIVVVVAIFLPDLITSIPKNLVDQSRVLLLLLAFDMALSIPMDTFGGALCALQRYDLLNVSLIVVMVAQAFGWWIVLSLHGGLVALGIVTVAISLVGQFARMQMLRRLLPRFRLSLRRFDRGLVRSFTITSGWYSMVQASDAILGGSDVLIVGAAAGVRAAAIYSVALRLGQLPVRIVQPRVYLLFTQANQLAARGDRQGLVDATQRITRFVLGLAVPAALILGFLASPTIRAWVGPQYHQAAVVIVILCIAGCIQSWSLTLRTAVNGWGMPKASGIVFGTEAVVHVGLGIVLSRSHGAVGMAIAALVGVVVMEGTIMLPVAYRKIGASMATAVGNALRSLGLPALCTAGAAWAVERVLQRFVVANGKLAGLSVVGASGLGLLVIFYFVFYFVGLRPEERVRLVAWERSKLRRPALLTGGLSSYGTAYPSVTSTNGANGAGDARSHRSTGTSVPLQGQEPESPLIGDLQPDFPIPSIGFKTETITATPHWFGPPGRPLSGWIHAPADNTARGAVVICPTMGLEAAYSYRALRHLAEMLAEAGFVALRFDYDGTGDSAGTGHDPGRVQAWLASVRTVVAYARDLNVGRVCVVGLRLGATLAAVELATSGAVDDLVLWDPCATGKSFLREQTALWSILRSERLTWGTIKEGDPWGPRNEEGAHEEGSAEIPGVVLGSQTAADLGLLSIADSNGALAARLLLLARTDRKVDRHLSERLALPYVETDPIAGQEELLSVSATIPQETLDRIVAWMSDQDGPRVPVMAAPVDSAVIGWTPDGRDIVERSVKLGRLGLFGILTEPEGWSGKDSATVLFLNAGAINHVGPGRLWTTLARQWAGIGLRSLRFDLSGIGDSPTRPSQLDQNPFPVWGLADVAETRLAVSPEDASNVVLVGLCSGAYYAIESALEQPVKALFGVNPVLHFFRAMTESGSYRADDQRGARDRRSGSSVRGWARALTRLESVQKIVRRLPDATWWIFNRIAVKEPPIRAFRDLVAEGIDVLVVTGAEETRALYRGDHRAFRSLASSGRFRMEEDLYLEHSLLESSGRNLVARVLTEHLEQLSGGRQPAGLSPEHSAS
jgi:O-antigen/teichoic acid export membrane protein/alpha/beta superfamily hydrolase